MYLIYFINRKKCICSFYRKSVDLATLSEGHLQLQGEGFTSVSFISGIKRPGRTIKGSVVEI